MRGIDFLTAPSRGDASRLALRSGEPVASPALALVASHGVGIVLFRAVGESGRPPVGLLALVLDAHAFVQQAVRHAGFGGFDVSLADLTDGTPQGLVGNIARPARSTDYRIRLAYGGRSYALRFSPTAAYMEEQRGLVSWTVLTAGLLLTALLGAMLLLTSGERAAIEAKVADRTARLRDREARLQAILDNAGDAIVTVDADGVVVSANPATAALFGYPQTHLQGLPFATLVPAADGAGGPGWLAGKPADERAFDGIDARGAPFPLAVSVSPVVLPGERLYVCILRDLTEQQRSQAHIHRLAHHDPLTGLENRAALGMRLEQQLAPGAPLAAAAGGAVHRPRPLQEDQRLARPPGRRPAAGGRQRAHEGPAARRRHPGAPGRRRIHHRAGRPLEPGQRERGGGAPGRVAAAAVLPERHHRAQRRQRGRGLVPGRRRRRRHPGAPCRHGDVRRQARGPRQFPVLLAGHERRHRTST